MYLHASDSLLRSAQLLIVTTVDDANKDTWELLLHMFTGPCTPHLPPSHPINALV